MILIKYSKTDGAEFIPHLDTLRHLIKTVRRTGVEVEYSKGFNPHMELYMSAPISVGLKSYAEYLLIDTKESAEGYAEKFSSRSPSGFSCVGAWNTDKKVNIAGIITAADYEVYGLNEFEVEKYLHGEVYITDKKGEVKEVSKKILGLKFEGEILKMKLAYGNDNLRPDYLVNLFKQNHGGEHIDIIKREAYVEGDKRVEDALNV